MNSQHHFVTPYSPWANGTVEVVNRVILDVLRSLLSEFRYRFDQWPLVLPLVQGVINHTPSRSLGGYAPVTVFTGLKNESPYRFLFDPKMDDFKHLRISDQDLARHVSKLAEVLIKLHREVSESKTRIQEIARGSANKRSKGRSQAFEVGDFVLVAQRILIDKLDARWKGPALITGTVNTQVYKVKNILTQKEEDVHFSRLKLYHDSSLNELVEKEIKDQLQYQERYQVETLLRVKGDQVLVKWLGFDEPSWEPLNAMREDVPKMVEQLERKSK